MDFPVSLPPKHVALAASLKIDPQEVEEHFVRGSGPGGQKINKTNNCVELLHKPTGVSVRIQRYRERSANRLSAYKLLILKIDERKRGRESERAQKKFKIQKQKQRRSRKSKEKMLEAKKQQGQKKLSRQSLMPGDVH